MFKVGDIVKSHYNPYDDEFSSHGIGVVTMIEVDHNYFDILWVGVYWASRKRIVLQHEDEIELVKCSK
jgi:hypothetical protein